MKPRKFVVELRGQADFRRTPEEVLIRLEEGDERAAIYRAERHCPVTEALHAAIAGHAEVYGWPTTKGLLAARAHHDPNPSAPSRGRREAEAVFTRGRDA